MIAFCRLERSREAGEREPAAIILSEAKDLLPELIPQGGTKESKLRRLAGVSESGEPAAEILRAKPEGSD